MFQWVPMEMEEERPLKIRKGVAGIVIFNHFFFHLHGSTTNLQRPLPQGQLKQQHNADLTKNDDYDDNDANFCEDPYGQDDHPWG